jgi:hypothetical protein
MAAMQKQMDAMQAQLDKLQAQKAAAAVAPAVPPGSTPVMVAPGNNTTFLIHGEPIQLYGVLDVSLDDTTKGLQSFYKSSGDGPVGNVGWQPAISSQSWVGLRSARTLANKFSAVYQLETQIDVSATSGTVNTNSNNDNTVKGALTSRNSFIGVGNQFSGSFLIGKTDAPYKTSTARMNPFSNMLGDYGVIMGNTGGDNRVESEPRRRRRSDRAGRGRLLGRQRTGQRRAAAVVQRWSVRQRVQRQRLLRVPALLHHDGLRASQEGEPHQRSAGPRPA